MIFKPDKQLKGTNYVYSSSPPLGEGSYSKVFLGVDLSSQKYVALKQIKSEYFQTMSQHYKYDFLKHYVQEIKTLQSVKTNNIVKLIDMIATDEEMIEIPTFLVFEYCNGGSLQKKLTQKKTLDLKTAFRYFIDIVTGIQDLYITNIIHRDIKPPNILIHNDRALISDFGFARFLDKMNEAGDYTLLGTIDYTCPQILNQAKYSSKCDVWSVGIVFYQMLYGKTPWTGTNLEMIHSNINSQPLVHPNIENIFIPNCIKQLIGDMLQIEEEDRISWEQIFETDIVKYSKAFFEVLNENKFQNDQILFQKELQQKLQNVINQKQTQEMETENCKF